ncbi:hypothetical protein ILYODFUR_038550 [Ilyodon furcidens]|uniref:Uncharacterized protein n=1 Tax=Ilyodon furcidens TaxID=33524 RepID=A0ABV0V1J4_9TELE
MLKYCPKFNIFGCSRSFILSWALSKLLATKHKYKGRYSQRIQRLKVAPCDVILRKIIEFLTWQKYLPGRGDTMFMKVVHLAFSKHGFNICRDWFQKECSGF